MWVGTTSQVVYRTHQIRQVLPSSSGTSNRLSALSAATRLVRISFASSSPNTAQALRISISYFLCNSFSAIVCNLADLRLCTYLYHLRYPGGACQAPSCAVHPCGLPSYNTLVLFKWVSLNVHDAKMTRFPGFPRDRVARVVVTCRVSTECVKYINSVKTWNH